MPVVSSEVLAGIVWGCFYKVKLLGPSLCGSESAGCEPKELRFKNLFSQVWELLFELTNFWLVTVR
jgi:hypothetical protein